MPHVSIKDHATEYDLETNEILFDGLERQGKTLPHGCLAGSCGSCRIIVEDGAQNLSSMSAIEENTVQAVIEESEKNNGKGTLDGKVVRLSCRAKILQGKVKITPLE